MRYETPGTYELIYKAVDDCGNETTQNRSVLAEKSFPLVFEYDARQGSPLASYPMYAPVSVGETYYFDAFERSTGTHITEDFTLENINDGQSMVYTGYCYIWFTFLDGYVTEISFQNSDLNSMEFDVVIDKR